MTAQIVLTMESQLTEDFVSNTMHFFGIDLATDTAAVSAEIVEFYSSIRGMFSSAVAIGPHLIKFYDTDAPAPNYPYAETSFTWPSKPTGDSLPSEVAVCLSYAAKRESGEPANRRRGRIYLGPISVLQNDDGRPSQLIRTTFLDAAETLAQEINTIPALGTGFWGIYSPTGGTIAAIKTLSVDNAFDTQRRRGVAPTIKDVRTLALPA